MTTKAQLLVKGFVIRVLEFGSTALLSLILMPYIIQALGDRMYGFWVLVGSFIGYYQLMDFGISSAMQRYISKAIGTNDHLDENQTINSGLLVFFISAALVLIVSFSAMLVLPLFITDMVDIRIFRTLLFLLGLNVAIGFIGKIPYAILNAHLRFDINTLIEVAKVICRSGLIVFFLIKGLDIVILATLTVACDFFSHLSKFFAVHFLFPHIRLSHEFIRAAKMKELLSYGIYAFTAKLADNLRFNTDHLVITLKIGISSVTPYSIGSRLGTYFDMLILAAMGMLTPVFSQYDARGDHALLKDRFLFTTKICGYFTYCIGGLLILYGKAFILRWMGPSYGISYIVMVILIIGFMARLGQLPSGQFLLGTSRLSFFTFVSIAEGICNLLLSLGLATKYGILGVAAGTTLPMLINRVMVLPVYSCRCLGVPLSHYYIKTYFPALLKSFLVFLPAYFLVSPYVPSNYPWLFAVVSLTGLYFTILIYFLGFTDKEKDYFKMVLSDMINASPLLTKVAGRSGKKIK